jgi:hypothetical protein
MKLAIQILRNAIKRFDQYLEENGLTIEEEIQRLQENGQIIKPDSSQILTEPFGISHIKNT